MCVYAYIRTNTDPIWALLGSPGLSWPLLVSPGLSWAPLGYSGVSWALVGSPGLSWALQSPGDTRRGQERHTNTHTKHNNTPTHQHTIYVHTHTHQNTNTHTKTPTHKPKHQRQTKHVCLVCALKFQINFIFYNIKWGGETQASPSLLCMYVIEGTAALGQSR